VGRVITLGTLVLTVCVVGCNSGGGLLSGLASKRGPHVPPAEQRALPIDAYFLGDALCPAKYVPGSLAGKWRTRAIREYAALRRALREHPYNLVSARYELSDPEPGQERTQYEDITIVELAKEHISTITNKPIDRDVEGWDPIDCRVKVKRTLQALINAAE
jgi:hypothetical protein